MKKINIVAALLFCVLSVSAGPFDTFPVLPNANETNEDVSLVGTTWWNPSEDLYFTLVFLTDHKVFQEGDYGGYGGYKMTYYYSFDGRKGEIRMFRNYREEDGVGNRVAEFIVTKDSEGNPSTLILTTYSMAPGDGGEQFYLSIQY